MRKILVKILTVGGLALLILPSCKNSDPVVTSNGSKIGTLQASTTSLVLDRTRSNDPTAAVTFNFTATQYNFKAALIATNLQIDSVGDNWKNPQVIAITKGATAQALSTISFDNVLLKILPADISSKINVRIQYQLSAYVSDYSNVISMDVTPFNATSWLYITGNFSGWVNPGAAEDSLESATGNGVYTGIINFENPNNGVSGDDEFLILPAKNWNHKYGTNEPQGVTNSTVAYDAPHNNTAPGEGYYMVTFDLNKGTIAYAKVDYYSVTGNEVVGGDWGVDQFMKYVNDGTNTWTSTLAYAPVSGGGFKIREDADWGNSWGTPKSSSVGAGKTGVLVSDQDDNLAVTAAGTYTLTFVQAPSVRTTATTITSPTTAGPPTIVAPYTFNGK